jgi:prephenate dehydrogenase
VRVGIVGTGLIGGSIGLAARAAGYRTAGYDLEPEHAARAAALGAVETALPSVEELIERSDIIVVAAPLEATLGLLRRFPPAPEVQLVTDVASVKGPVVAAARGLPHFVGGHPIAGSERSGPDAARADLFVGRAWALVPPRDDALLARAEAFVASLGARPIFVEAERHDAVVAFTSHLPQMLGSALAASLGERLAEPAVRALCGSGIRSMTRLAESAWPVWSGILDANAAAVAQEVRAFANVLRSVADELDGHDGAALAARFADAASSVARLARTNAAQSPVIPDT